MAEQWYTNKDLFEMLQGLKEDMHETRTELKETREAMKQYNNLREQIAQCQTNILTIQQRTVGQSVVWTNIRNWGAIIIAVASLIYTFMKGR